jgi:hypothetical protein
MEEYDVVELTIDISDEGLVKGQRGTILMIHNEEYCEIEFCDSEGITLFLGALPMNILNVVWKVNNA